MLYILRTIYLQKIEALRSKEIVLSSFPFLSFLLPTFLTFLIMNLSLQFRAASDELGGEPHVRECLKRHFADICSDGDLVLHEFLDSTMKLLDIQVLLEKHGALGSSVITTLINTLKHWRLNKRCIINPWWAC